MMDEDLLSTFRKWRHTGLGEAVMEGSVNPRQGQGQFRVMSYNLLAPVFADRHLHLYTGDPGQLEWDTRWQRIQEEVASYKPSIVTLQEVQFVDNIFRKDILPWFTQV